jgi:hypothetical protein
VHFIIKFMHFTAIVISVFNNTPHFAINNVIIRTHFAYFFTKFVNFFILKFLFGYFFTRKLINFQLIILLRSKFVIFLIFNHVYFKLIKNAFFFKDFNL